MTVNPIESIGGITTTAGVPKADIVAWAKARVPQVLADATEVRNTTLAGQLIIFINATGQLFHLDTSDTTTADDGIACIVSLDGKRFKHYLSLYNGFTPEAFGGVADTTGTAAASCRDNTPYIQAAINAAQTAGGGRVVLGSGVYAHTDLLVSARNIYIEGAGEQATTLLYRPTTDGSAITFQLAGGGELPNVGVYKLTIASAETTYAKNALHLVDTSNSHIQNVAVNSYPIGTLWRGGGSSAGIRTNGREFCRVSDFTAYAEIPIYIDTNPNSTISADSGVFHNINAVAHLDGANSNPCILVADGVNLFNTHFTGHQNWEGGTDGFRWIATGATQTSYGLTFSGIKSEQSFDAVAGTTGYAINIQTNTQIRGLEIANSIMGDRNGIKLRGVVFPRISNVVFIPNIANLRGLDVDSTAGSVEINSCYWYGTTTASLGSLNLVRYSELPAGFGLSAALPFSGVYSTTLSEHFINVASTTFNNVGVTSSGATASIQIGGGKVVAINNSMTVTATDGAVLNVGGGGTLGTAAYTAIDTDGTLAANSATRVPSQSAVVTYVAARIAALDVMVFKGVIDCSANPNYPAADAGATYRVSVAGKIGGASGTNVEAGDILLCLLDSTASGTQAGVGANWSIIQVNIDGAVVGPASATSGNVATFNGTTGKLIQDSGKALPTGTIVGTSDTQALTGKTYNGLTVTTSTGTLTVANGKTATINNTLTFTGTDSSSVAFGAGGTVLYSGGAAGGDLGGTYPNPTIDNAAVIAKVLTGYAASAGTIAATDTILQAFDKIGGLVDNAAWTSYTPTFTSTTGTATTSGRYKVIGKTCFFSMSLTFTSAVTGNVSMSLPFTSTGAVIQAVVGRELVTTGKTVAGDIAASATVVENIRFYDNTTLTANTSVFVIAGSYEIA